ncbi:CatB-related O-acetyltransferase [Akkermansiaceae bacterium]|nr:CatB-related O-acetyltransferase [Akkermansiaceae bacterium]
MREIIQKFIDRIVTSSFRFRRRNIIKELIAEKQLIIGTHTYGINNLDIHRYKGSESKIFIGKYCSLSKNITVITGGNHPLEWISTYPFRANWDMGGKYEDGMPYSNGDIIIGNDVWIGTGVTILSGVTIGHGAVVAAGSIIVKDVPPYSIFGGNPGKIIRFRFSEIHIEKLLKIKWWDWSDQKVKKNVRFLNSKTIDTFLNNNTLL